MATGKRQLAPLAPRAGAALIDALAIGAIGTVVSALAVVGLRAAHAMPGGGAQFVVGLGGIVAACLYGPILMARAGEHNGQTWGKQMLGLRVVRELRGEMNLGTGLAREAVGKQLLAALTAGLYIPLDYAWALWDPERQTLHDKVADTLVVVAEAPRTVVDGLPAPEGWLPPGPDR
ncbi:MAG: hypothetical protein QOK31_411 [Solirubrobacteraceae bacterium]|jgi:uncharacterized RDD family membrane protein YckC|nr:hypothetical protein [Solirubrobacteraceae bacterium]